VKTALQRIVDVRPEETPAVVLTFLGIASVVASFILGKAVRNGLFLSQFAAYKLVYVYVGVPILLSLFVPIYTRMAARSGQRAVITGSLAFFLLNVLAFWALFRFRPHPLLVAVFYVWVNCYGIIVPVQVWNFANSIFDTRQAKRLFGLIGGGASAGAIAGGFLARMLVKPMGGAVNLLLVLAALIAAAAAFMNLTLAAIPRRPPPPRPDHGRGPRLAKTLGLVGRSPYLKRIAGLVFLVAVVTQWTQFQFLLVAQERHAGDADSLTAFLGGFNMYFGIVAMLVQVFLTGTALRRFGIALTILLLPLSLGLGSALILVYPVFWSVLVTNSFDQSLRFSIDKATFELLYLPLSPAVRSEVKAAIDMIFNRMADAAGGLLLGLATQGFDLGILRVPGAGFGLRGIAALNLGLIVAWISVAVALRRGYVDAIRESIRQHSLDAEGPAPLFDRATAEILAGKLAAGDEAEILYALGLFEAQHRQTTHPALRSLLAHPSPAVRRRAVSILDAAGDTSVVAQVEALIEDESLETRTEALCYLARHSRIDPLVRIRELGDFEDYSVRAGLIAFLARPGESQNLDAARVLLDAMSEEPGPEGRRARLEAARLIGALPDALGAPLGRLIRDPDVDVARTALQTAGRFGRVELLDVVLERLRDPQLSTNAGEALVAMGDAVVRPLHDRLFDPAVPTETRRAIPAVLVRIGTVPARRALMESLLHADPAVRLGIVSSLNKLSRPAAGAAIDPQVVETVLAAEIMGHYRSYQVLATLGRDLRHDDSALQALRESMDQEAERIFRLMALLMPDDDLHAAYLALRSPISSARSNALELLDNILRPPMRDLVVPLFDSHVSVEGRSQLANRIVGAPFATREEAVAALLSSGDTWLRSCAARAIGALGLVSFEAELEKWLDDPDPLLRETARSARLALLQGVHERAPGSEPPLGGGWESSENLGVG
jgi:ATP:ADP antiporter, AAA family